MQEHKSKILELEEHISKAKIYYADTLRHLEKISEEIHAQREQDQPKDEPIKMCGGRSPPVGAETISSTGTEGRQNDWVDGKGGVTNVVNWVEMHNSSRWGDVGAEVKRSGLDSLSMVSLQTIISDLEKCDSVEHLGHLSSDVSLSGEEGERDGLEKGKGRARQTSVDISDQFLKQHNRSVSL